LTESKKSDADSGKSKKRQKYFCSVCSCAITQEEFQKHDGKCQVCWSRQLEADLVEMFGEDLDVELILKDPM
jgi:hypothetical protein